MRSPILLKTFLVLLLVTFIILLVFSVLSSPKASPEISLFSISPLGTKYGKMIAASCGFTLHNSADEFTYCSYTCPGGGTVEGVSQCGGACQLKYNELPATCTDQQQYGCGAYACPISYDLADKYGNGSWYCKLKPQYFCPSSCTNGATNFPQCNNNTCTNVETPYSYTCQQAGYPAGYTGYYNFTYLWYCTTNTGTAINVVDTCTNGGGGSCTNGATNYPQCDNNSGSFCQAGITPIVDYIGSQIFLSNIYYYLSGTAPTPRYSVGSCSGGIPANHIRICAITRTSSDGSETGSWVENYDTNHTTWSYQSSKSHPYNESLTIACGYYSTLTYTVTGGWSNYVSATASILHPNYGLPCSTAPDACGVVNNGTYNMYGICNASTNTYSSCNRTNVCGQVFPGIQCPSGCTADSSFTNDTCIQNFKPSIDKVNPNGSVEFSWDINSTSSVPNCSFVDLTSPTPRPIPGLQNLNPTIDKVRITNIQASTRFCLVCNFYSLLNGSLLGQAAVHQWVRVQRIGEN